MGAEIGGCGRKICLMSGFFLKTFVLNFLTSNFNHLYTSLWFVFPLFDLCIKTTWSGLEKEFEEKINFFNTDNKTKLLADFPADLKTFF